MIKISRKQKMWALAMALLIFLAFAINGVIKARSMGFLRSPVFEMVPPQIPTLQRPAVLVFSKTNSFIHKEAIPAAKRALQALSTKRGWAVYLTDNAAVHNGEDLARFDVIIWNNVTGDVLTQQQRQAMRGWLEQGGGFVGLHAAGDDSHNVWPWYQNEVIRARFIGHPLKPQFQSATVRIERPKGSIAAGLPWKWQRTDEWYSFASSPRANGVTVLATLDESTYSPGSMFGTELAMGDDHPIIWKHCVMKGRIFYSAMGHTAESFEETKHLSLLENAIEWAGQLTPASAADLKNDRCPADTSTLRPE